MKLILEGPDNAGKTTLARRLLDHSRIGIRYFHPGAKPADVSAEMSCLEEQLKLLQLEDPILMDRITAISQRVYNPDPQWDDVRKDYMDLMLFQRPIIVYCRPSTDRLLRTQDLTWREGETEEHKQKIITRQHEFVAAYDKLFTTIPCISYDFDDDQHRELIYTKLLAGLLGSVDDEMWFHEVINRRF